MIILLTITWAPSTRRAGDYRRAVECYALSHQLDPRAIPPLVNASIAYNALGQNDKAERSLREALRTDPTNPAVNLNLGMLLGELGRLPEAEQAFRTAWKADPQLASAAYNLGVLLAEQDLQQAIELCRAADRLRPDEPKYAFATACFLQRAGQIPKAIDQLRQLLQAHPSYADGYGLLGSLLVEQGQTTPALRLYREAASNTQLPPQARRFFQLQAEKLSAQ